MLYGLMIINIRVGMNFDVVSNVAPSFVYEINCMTGRIICVDHGFWPHEHLISSVFFSKISNIDCFIPLNNVKISKAN